MSAAEEYDDFGDVANDGANDPWEPPIPFDDVGSLPPFPVEALSPIIRDWALAVAEATQTPVDLPAAMALATLSAIVAKKYEVQIRPGHREPLCTYWNVAMPPAERKSAVYNAATRPIYDWEEERARALDHQIQAAVSNKTIAEKAHKFAQDKAAKSGSPTDKQRAQELAIQLAETYVPAAPRIVADDVTLEKLSQLMATNGGKMAIMSAEGGIFDIVAGLYSDGKANIDVLLKGHPGDPLTVDRVGRAPLKIRRPALTLGLCVQPSVLDGLATNRQFRGRGLLARFLYVLPTSKIGSRKIGAEPVDGLVSQAWDDLCLGLLNLPEHRDEKDEIKATIIHFSPDAVRVLDAFNAQIEPRLGPGGDLEPIRDWAGKLVGACARIAGILHLAEGCVSSVSSVRDTGGSVCSVEVCQRTVKIASFLLSHALAAFRLMGADPVVGKARTLLSSLRAHTTHTTHTTRRDLHILNRSTFTKASDIDSPLALLEEHGFVRVVEHESTAKGGRRPSPTILVNPAVYG